MLTVLLCSLSLAKDVPGVTVDTFTHADVHYTVAIVDLTLVEFDLYGPAIDLPTLQRKMAAEGREVIVATNAGIFQDNEIPLGLAVGIGTAHERNLADGDGNFYLKPNGIFWVDDEGAHTAPTEAYAPHGTVRLATQSGPMLLIDGALHPEFRPASSNFLLRSGVCASTPTTVHLAISDGGVRFYDFATMLKERYGCKDALFLDGTISILMTPQTPLDHSMRYGGILAVTTPPITPPPAVAPPPDKPPRKR